MMKFINYRYIAIGITMLLAAGLSVAMTPIRRVADNGPTIDLEAMIPKQFSEWQLDVPVIPLLINPATQAGLDKIYSQTLARTYTNNRGERIMLAIAYGGDQGDAMQVHKPEACYPAQGFQVSEVSAAILDTRFGPISVKRLEAQQGQRFEPVTYWVTIGNQVVSSNLKKKLVEIDYGLKGLIPDGLLFRVSSIGRDSNQQFATQAIFVSQLMDALDTTARKRIAGIVNPS